MVQIRKRRREEAPALLQKYMIPKCYLIDRLCSDDYNNTNRKSLWHIQTLNEFSRKMKRK